MTSIIIIIILKSYKPEIDVSVHHYRGDYIPGILVKFVSSCNISVILSYLGPRKILCPITIFALFLLRILWSKKTDQMSYSSVLTYITQYRNYVFGFHHCVILSCVKNQWCIRHKEKRSNSNLFEIKKKDWGSRKYRLKLEHWIILK